MGVQRLRAFLASTCPNRSMPSLQFCLVVVEVKFGWIIRSGKDDHFADVWRGQKCRHARLILSLTTTSQYCQRTQCWPIWIRECQNWKIKIRNHFTRSSAGRAGSALSKRSRDEFEEICSIT